jgi:hypothetical protein
MFGDDDEDQWAFIAEYNLANYLLANMTLAGLEFGVAIPGMFPQPSGGYMTWPVFNQNAGEPQEIVDNSLLNSIFGLKFEMSPVEFAAQFRLSDYGAYFGGKFFSGPLTLGLSFIGRMNAEDDFYPFEIGEGDFRALVMRVGVDVDYNGGLFGAGLRGWFNSFGNYRTSSDDGETWDSQDGGLSFIGVEPRFWYNAMPNHLRFQLDAGFYFASSTDDDVDLFVNWAVRPQIFWNFKGNGAPGGYWHWAEGYNGWYQFTGMMVRYTMRSNYNWFNDEVKMTTNEFDVVFRWGL